MSLFELFGIDDSLVITISVSAGFLAIAILVGHDRHKARRDAFRYRELEELSRKESAIPEPMIANLQKGVSEARKRSVEDEAEIARPREQIKALGGDANTSMENRGKEHRN